MRSCTTGAWCFSMPRAASPPASMPCRSGRRRSAATSSPPAGRRAIPSWAGSATPNWSAASPTCSTWPAPSRARMSRCSVTSGWCRTPAACSTPITGWTTRTAAGRSACCARSAAPASRCWTSTKRCSPSAPSPRRPWPRRRRRRRRCWRACSRRTGRRCSPSSRRSTRFRPSAATCSPSAITATSTPT
ncbi:hypothetical protein D3C71_1023160 [compost metagenome]